MGAGVRPFPAGSGAAGRVALRVGPLHTPLDPPTALSETLLRDRRRRLRRRPLRVAVRGHITGEAPVPPVRYCVLPFHR